MSLRGFEQALLKTFRKAVETNARKLKAGNDKIEKDDIFAGLTAVLTVRLAEPQFEGQTKEILGTSAVRAIVAKVVEQEINAKLKVHVESTTPPPPVEASEARGREGKEGPGGPRTEKRGGGRFGRGDRPARTEAAAEKPAEKGAKAERAPEKGARPAKAKTGERAEKPEKKAKA